MKAFTIIILVVGIWGCLGPASAPVKNYTVEYEPLFKEERQNGKYTLTVSSFSADNLYADPFMIKRPAPFRREAHSDRRWRISPADMTADLIRRDLRVSGLFAAVLGPREGQDSRFVLKGRVEDFLESFDDKERKAILAITTTLIDRTGDKTGGKVVLQKSYRTEVAMKDNCGEALAQAMSQALATISSQLIADTARVIRQMGP
jgi:ABC-type uncharacterized transport system auxiliary subunit